MKDSLQSWHVNRVGDIFPAALRRSSGTCNPKVGSKSASIPRPLAAGFLITVVDATVLNGLRRGTNRAGRHSRRIAKTLLLHHYILSTTLTGGNIPRRLAASGTEHRNHAENRAIYGV
jgi:hypothetical protein